MCILVYLCKYTCIICILYLFVLRVNIVAKLTCFRTYSRAHTHTHTPICIEKINTLRVCDEKTTNQKGKPFGDN